MSEMFVTILCLVYGESTDHAFEVEISKKASISKLRKEIWKELKSNRNINVKDLILWNVSIPYDNNDAFTFLKLEENEEKKIRKLKFLKKVATELPEESLYSEHIHILVQYPKIHIQNNVKDDNKKILRLSEQLDTLNIYPATFDPKLYEGEDELVSISDDCLACFDVTLSILNVCLLCSPLASGKTTLSTILKKFLIKHKNRKVKIISMLWLNEIDLLSSPTSFDDYWKSQIGRTWTDCINGNESMNILIDEVQILYGHIPFFWNNLKGLMQSAQKNINFSVSIGLKYLRLSWVEYEEFLVKYIHKVQTKEPVYIDDEVKKTIYNISRDHASIIRYTLDLLQNIYCYGQRDAGALLKHLLSAGFHKFISCTCSFYWLQDWKPTKEESDFLRIVLNQCDTDSAFSVNLENFSTIAQKFIHSGLIVHREYDFQFTAPIMRIILGIHLYNVSYDKRFQLL
ncbi:9423_t:CDS:2 [Funneliformis geosporum]|uniref:4595_t:CDS:1 n=1 Tax=Funneliformis geosporum TaxID=1117311 RepID=A0A9W4T4H6_9GLOM|nr:9423_t:CDS:2 [Funneliformis geosporum]CAI2191480.1 4595_t:CDS:2 [Funneliformis geosporum]